MDQLLALAALRDKLSERRTSYRDKVGHGVDEHKAYQRYVGQIRELTKVIEEDLPEAFKKAREEE